METETNSLPKLKGDNGLMLSVCETPRDSLMPEDRHEGLMNKQSQNFIKSLFENMKWQARYFVLEFRVLKYYKNKSDYENQLPPKGVLNFQQVMINSEYFDE